MPTETQSQTKTKKKSSAVWLTVLLLFVCVAATTFALMGRMNNYQVDDSGAIDITGDGEQPGNNSDNSGDNSGSGQSGDGSGQTDGDGDGDSTGNGGSGGETDNTPEATPTPVPTPTPIPARPGFESSDENVVWSTDTQVEIFRVSYENGQQEITVNSADGDKLIAPGTENSYTFKLKNTGNVPVDYTVEVDAFVTPGDYTIPVDARLARYDGLWVVGGSEEWVDTAALDAAEDSDSLSAGNFTYYTLDWRWPFDGNDELDTLLGSAEEDITLTIVIRTVATANTDGGGGLTPPQTGDLSMGTLWAILAGGSLVMILILLFTRKKEDETSETEGARQ